MKLWRNLDNGKLYTEPLLKGVYYPIEGRTALYSLRGFERPIIAERWIRRVL